jgi:perosamine synthetase
MTSSLRALEFLVEEEFSVEVISLRVLASNKRAIEFYENQDYTCVESTPIRVTSNFEDNILEGIVSEDDFFLKMEKNLTIINAVPNQILTAGPSISNLESFYVDDAVRNGWNSNHSDYLNRFELEFAKRIGSRFAMATSSCTGAIHLALLALGIGDGDEVIVPEITWVATASAVSYVGATPIFADVDPNSWTISIDSIRSLITEKTKAIIPVHLYGYPSNMEEIMSLAKNFNLRVVEDAAPAIGASFGETSVGTFGDFGCFSFQGAKLLVSGEGGVLVTDDEELFLKAKKIQDHGRKPGTFWIEEIGHKYKMNNITGALGLGQLLRLDNQILRKQRINSWYTEFLTGVEGLKFQNEVPGSKSICWMTSIEFDSALGVDIEDLMRRLKMDGVDSRPVFPAISQYPIWGRNHEAGPNAKRIGANSINLPSGVKLPKAAIEKVSGLIREIVSK